MTGHNPTTLRRAAERAAAPLPALLAEAERVAASVALGTHGRRRPGHGETFWEYRRHRTEDGAQAVDWRRSARGQHLFVRETEWEAANAVYLWRDGSPGMGVASAGLPLKKDRAAVCLMALASLLYRGGERIAALGETGRPRSGRTGLEVTARALATGPGQAQAVETGDVARHARLVLASDFLDPPETWAARLARLNASGAGGVLLRIIDPSEEDFPFAGRTRFAEPAGKAHPLLLGRAEDARDAYRQVWAEHSAAITLMARKVGWTLVTHRTDRPAGNAVLALYQAMAPGAMERS
ncbi:MAG: DUF58 domain-containing protein [Caulobacterales bacterium]|uniref:DUF58 domain-containing protein n=1 Tax=Glycocaulis sp. TaxID=1969725 RepID=UPI003FA04BDB